MSRVDSTHAQRVGKTRAGGRAGGKGGRAGKARREIAGKRHRQLACMSGGEGGGDPGELVGGVGGVGGVQDEAMRG